MSRLPARFGRCIRLLSAVLVAAWLSPAQNALGQDAAESRLRGDLARALSDLQRSEAAALAAFGDGSLQRIDAAAPPLGEHQRALGRYRALLDTAVFQTAWGPAELSRLRATYTDSPLFELYGARLALHHGAADSALAIMIRLARRSPASVDVQTALADAFEAVGDSGQAIVALTRALEMEPENATAFDRLRELHRRAGTLDRLLSQVKRLQARLPESRILIEREVELSHRMNRGEDARAAAERLTEEGK